MSGVCSAVEDKLETNQVDVEQGARFRDVSGTVVCGGDDDIVREGCDRLD